MVRDSPCRQLTSSCTASRRGSKRNPCAATHSCHNLLEGSVPVPVTADCAVPRNTDREGPLAPHPACPGGTSVEAETAVINFAVINAVPAPLQL